MPTFMEMADQGIVHYLNDQTPQAVRLLVPVLPYDDHARLLVGWMRVREGQRRRDTKLTDTGMSDLLLGMKLWCYAPEKSFWLRHPKAAYVLRTAREEQVTTEVLTQPSDTLSLWLGNISILQAQGLVDQATLLMKFARSNSAWAYGRRVS